MCDYSLSNAVALCRRKKEPKLCVTKLDTFLVFSLPHTSKQGCCCVSACKINADLTTLRLCLHLVQGAAAKHYLGLLSLLKLLARAESASSAGHTGGAASDSRG